jgi:nicotinamide-nucleotide amidase
MWIGPEGKRARIVQVMSAYAQLDAREDRNYCSHMMDDAELQRLATRVGAHLMDAERRLVTAESCSGGWIGKTLTDIPGSSAFYLGGVVSYSNTLKQSLLGVLPSTLAQHGAVSEAAVHEMAIGALETLGGQVAIAVTGIAGPDGAQPGKPVGTVWFGWAWRQGDEIESRVALETFSGDREAVRRQTVAKALEEILKLDV